MYYLLKYKVHIHLTIINIVEYYNSYGYPRCAQFVCVCTQACGKTPCCCLHTSVCLRSAHIQYVGWHYNLLSKCQGGMRPHSCNIRCMLMCCAHTLVPPSSFVYAGNRLQTFCPHAARAPLGNQNIVFAGVPCRMCAQIYKCSRAGASSRARRMWCPSRSPPPTWWLLFECVT